MNADEPEFLGMQAVLSLHTDSINRFGGTHGIRDPGLVESALASAQNSWFYGRGGLFEVAAAYAFHLAESQAFLDGNKRTAVAAALTFLEGNGHPGITDDGSLYAAMIAVACKRMDKVGLAAVLRQLAEHVP